MANFGDVTFDFGKGKSIRLTIREELLITLGQLTVSPHGHVASQHMALDIAIECVGSLFWSCYAPPLFLTGIDSLCDNLMETQWHDMRPRTWVDIMNGSPHLRLELLQRVCDFLALKGEFDSALSLITQ
eukprot:GHVR01166251.1.p1 GENE.GHVR01166251.1~~GHVR01166251.1.p1  ORF type:complete len:129 (+),score=31.31 GHVR01166251.1:73-459(+)